MPGCFGDGEMVRVVPFLERGERERARAQSHAAGRLMEDIVHEDFEWHETADMPVLYWTCCDRYSGPFYIVYPYGQRYC